MSGYLIGSQEANKRPLPPNAELAWWYQFYFATERGRLGYEQYRRDFAKLIWKTASPTWRFDEATFERSADPGEPSNIVDVVVHNYRWRLGVAGGESRYDDLERQLALGPPVIVPGSPSKATRTVLPIRRPPHTGRSSSVRTPTG